MMKHFFSTNFHAYLILLLATIFFGSFSLKSGIREDIIFDDFESGTYGKWTISGEAFGTNPVTGALSGQMQVNGYNGNYFVNSFHQGDKTIGTLTSEAFIIERNYINFLLGGGNHYRATEGTGTNINLYIGGKLIYSTTPDISEEELKWNCWDLTHYQGEIAYIKIIDNVTGGWGHINVDDFIQCDRPSSYAVDNHSIHINIEKPYLQIPTQNSAPFVELTFKHNNNTTSTKRVRLAIDAIDQWIPIYLKEFVGSELELSLHEFDLRFRDILDEIRQTDHPEIAYQMEKFRPEYHFAPPFGWMNDPNGMVYFDGKYHLFYQYNPYSIHWDFMHWGHAVSEDLVHWEHLPIALFPDNLGVMFSGCIVVDKTNTAGFGENAFIALYTTTEPRQAQSLAYSTDEGLSWTKYEGNPVLWNHSEWDFRDPKVFWHEESRKWIMVIAANYQVEIYSSSNLKEWTREDGFGGHVGQHGSVWECPDLIQVPIEGTAEKKWVMLVSIAAHAPNGGSGTQYFIGDFDGKHFILTEDTRTRWIDYGKDNYAGVTWSNILTQNQEPVFIGWMSNWEYAGAHPTEYFKSSNTFPRSLSLVHTPDGLMLKSTPITTIGKISREVYSKHLGSINQEWHSPVLDVMENGTYKVEMDFSNSKQSWKVTLRNEANEYVAFGYNSLANEVYFDRQESGNIISSTFAKGNHHAYLQNQEAASKLLVLVDKSSVELFINDGRLVMSELVFPSMPYNKISINPENSKLQVDNFSITKLSLDTSTGLFSTKNTQNSLDCHYISATKELSYTYTLESESDVAVRVISLDGKLQVLKPTQRQQAGTYTVKQKLQNPQQGIYILQLFVNDRQHTAKFPIF